MRVQHKNNQPMNDNKSEQHANNQPVLDKLTKQANNQPVLDKLTQQANNQPVLEKLTQQANNQPPQDNTRVQHANNQQAQDNNLVLQANNHPMNDNIRVEHANNQPENYKMTQQVNNKPLQYNMRLQHANNQQVQDTMMHHANNQQTQDNNMVVQANKQSVDYKIMVQHDNKQPSKDNNTIRHQEGTATNGMPDDDKSTSTKDKTIIIHNHVYTDINKGNGPTNNHAQLQRTVTIDEELDDVQTLADNSSRQPFYRIRPCLNHSGYTSKTTDRPASTPTLEKEFNKPTQKTTESNTSTDTIGVKQKLRKRIKIGSLNVQNIRENTIFAQSVMKETEILFIQQHWLFKFEEKEFKTLIPNTENCNHRRGIR